MTKYNTLLQKLYNYIDLELKDMLQKEYAELRILTV